MSKVYLVNGDITSLLTDAIITLINAEGDWHGKVDHAIIDVAGDQYHRQAKQILNSSGLEDGQMIVAKLQIQHTGRFLDVIFVVDERKVPLGDLVFAALKFAYNEGYQHVSLPMMRTGVMLGEFEPTLEATLDQLILGIERFKKLKSRMVINVFTYKDLESFEYLLDHLN